MLLYIGTHFLLGRCRRAPQESQSWRSSNASPDRQPRRHGDASGRRRKSAPEFRVVESEEGHSGTRRDSSSRRNTDPEGETTEKREKERNGEPDAREETEKSVNPEYPGRETEERTEEPPREETEDATACHGPGGSWLDKETCRQDTGTRHLEGKRKGKK
ncbi:hypothetical protein NDU88_003585 [Pleurodeles waltl]|uniref:Uncharacterized protein n=1 Tax=Pleurodeles waltl TaxID=8319 RepID=A0AAV7NIL6_PLEWA|nr:hypothetical protein NDU88_003585 [Pleurodeles waltl]